MNSLAPVPAAPDHAARAHHPFSPSKQNYIDPEVGGCYGFQNRESENSAAAEEGTDLHETVETVLRSYIKQGLTPTKVKVQSYAASALPPETPDETRLLLNHVWRYLDSRLTPGVRIYIEAKCRVRTDSGVEINYGHLDLFLVYPNNTAVLADWKFGHVPVLPADVNRQGQNYAAGMFQSFPGIRSITVEFVQPRRQWVTSHTYTRVPHAELLRAQLMFRIARAVQVQSSDPMPADELNPGAACEYCARVGACPGYLRTYRTGIQKLGGLAPVSLDLDAIDTPEKAALARAWVDFMEAAAEPIKQRAFALAEANGGRISTTLPDGHHVEYEIQRRGLDREIGNPVEVATALQDFVAPQQLLAAAKLSLGKTLEIAGDAVLECNPDIGTKKAAREQVESLLSAHGLLSRPDGEIRFLKQVKTKSKTITTKPQK